MPDEIIVTNPEAPTAPVSVQTQVQDIFSDTESSVMTSATPSSAAPGTTYSPYTSSTRPGMSRKTMILVVGAVVALIGIIGAAILIYTIVKKTSEPTTQTTTPTTVQQPVTTPPVTAPVSPEPIPNPTPSEPSTTPPAQDGEATTTPAADRDGDGLTDAEELTFNTNPDLPDTDNDGLTDREEVKVYKTDPRNADTDADGYLDGQEVKGGYNPNGSGPLYTIQ